MSSDDKFPADVENLRGDIIKTLLDGTNWANRNRFGVWWFDELDAEHRIELRTKIHVILDKALHPEKYEKNTSTKEELPPPNSNIQIEAQAKQNTSA